MAKVYLDKDNRICVQTDSSVFRSDGSKKLSFNLDEEFAIDSDTVSKLFVLFNDEDIKKIINNKTSDKCIIFSSFLYHDTFYIFTTDEMVDKLSDKLSDIQELLDNEKSYSSQLSDEICNLKEKIKEHNSLPLLARFKKIK